MIIIGLKNDNYDIEVSVIDAKTQAMMWSINFFEIKENNLKEPFKFLINIVLEKEENGKKFDPSAIVNNCKVSSCFCSIY